MKLAYKIHHIQLADFRERTRTYKFLILLGITVFAACFIIPPADREGNTIRLIVNGNGKYYRGIYNSAYIGTAVAVMIVFMLTLFGFYIVRNSIEHDRSTGVGEIFAATPTSKVIYLLGKLLSNFLVLTAIVGVTAVVTTIIYFIRGEMPINFWELLSPIIMIVLPTMLFTAAIAVLFETIPLLRSTFGNIMYFFFWITIITIEAVGSENANMSTLDIFGFNSITKSMSSIGEDMGFSWTYGGAADFKIVLWEGINWNTQIIANRLMIVMVCIIIVLFASVFFNRFDSSKSKRKIKNSDQNDLKMDTVKNIVPMKNISSDELTSVLEHFKFSNMVKAEMKLMLKGLKWWWICIVIGFIIACICVPIDTAQKIIFPITWILPIGIWSSLGCREKRYNTEQIIFSCPYFVKRQFPAAFIGGVITAILTGSGMLIRLIVTGNWQGIAAFIVGALFITSLALTLGVMSGNKKLFEMIYIIIWYIGPMSGAGLLNFMDVSGGFETINKTLLYFMITIILLVLSTIRRYRVVNFKK